MGQLNALVIEDENTKFAIAEIHLKRIGLDVQRAESLAEATHLVLASKYDLIVLDGLLGDQSIDETLEFLRNLVTGRPEQVVLANSSTHNSVLLAEGCTEVFLIPPDRQLKRIFQIP